MSQSYGAVSVGDTATQIVAANTARRNLEVSVVSGADIFIGPDSSLTTSNGIPLYISQVRTQDKVPEGYTGAIYGITASGTADVRYWENSNAG